MTLIDEGCTKIERYKEIVSGGYMGETNERTKGVGRVDHEKEDT
jgi:hypothetical protein